jgi:peptidoglycan/xylan/chitin deacetylase (PgdA/CDA1 family)
MVALVERLARNAALSQSREGRPEIALTFDDGPHPEWTPSILDVLDRSGAKATFFVVGRHAARHPDIVRETRRRGHEIGTHLYSHDRRTVFDDALFAEELTRSTGELESLIGEPVRWLRFPYGARGRQQPHAVARQFGLRTVHWTYSSHDGRLSNAGAIVARVAAGLRPGVIVLLHDALADEGERPHGYIASRDATVDALSGIVSRLAAGRLTPVTLSALFRRDG